MPQEAVNPKILINHPSADNFLQLVCTQFPDIDVISTPTEALADHIAEADILLSNQFPADLIEKAKNLKWFQCTMAGVDSALSVRDKLGDIIVTNARGIHGDVIADYVMAGATMLHWDFRGFLKDQSSKAWKARPVVPLADMTFGVIGLGSIGATIARRASSAGMKVLGTRRDASLPVEGVNRVYPFEQLGEMLPECDFVVLALPATRETIGSISASTFSRMKPGAIFINIARGNIVVESEMVQALQQGVIAGAVLDVFEVEPLPDASPLWDMPNVIVTPHVAGYPSDYTGRVASIFTRNVERFLAGQPLENVVDPQRGY